MRPALLSSSLLAAGLLSIAWSQPTPSPAEREAHWRQDIQFMVDGLRATGHTVDMLRGISTRGQIDFLKLYPPGPFNAALESLQADIPKISDSEIVLRLIRLIASANVAHNGVDAKAMGFAARLPLGLSWFQDGLAVMAAAPEYSAALGTHVVKIGTMTPEQLLTAVTPYISHENDVWLREQAPGFMTVRAVLEHFGLLGVDGSVPVTLQKPGAEPFTLPVGLARPFVTRVSVIEALHIPVPLSLSRPGTYYWNQYLSDSQTLYIQYNRCANDPKLPFHDFARQTLAEADAHAVKRVVIDLRLNGGGDSRIIDPLKSGLASRLKKIGRVYALIGPETFSSAEMNAEELRSGLHAVLVGESAGGMPGGYGEVKLLTLPNSKLVVRYTTKNFGSPAGKEASTLEPDLAAPRTLADALAGRDPALEAAIAAVR